MILQYLNIKDGKLSSQCAKLSGGKREAEVRKGKQKGVSNASVSVCGSDKWLVTPIDSCQHNTRVAHLAS